MIKNNNMVSIVATNDGSHTIQLQNKNVTYHSINGAIQETNHVFINAGLKYLIEQGYTNINLLEVGFGTGLNVLLSVTNAINQKIFCNTIEPFPLDSSIIQKLNYGTVLQQQNLFDMLHNSAFDLEIKVNSNFTLLKSNCYLQSFESTKKFNLVYFDAFAPDDQPELWTEEVFTKVYNFMQPNAVLVTYCSKGIVNRTMKHVGFAIQKLQGPPGKREMIRATKI